MKTGLVMEGGAMRGMFTAGVIDVLMEHGVTFDGAAGVSAGAAFGCNIKSHQIGRVIRYNTRFCRDWRYHSVRSLMLTGNLYGTDMCYRAIPDELDPFDYETFRASPMAFWLVCTDAATGEAVYHQITQGSGEDMDWIRASASMPMVSRPVMLEGRPLLDGGVTDAIPLRFLEEQGYPRNVVVLTQPKGYVKRPNSMLPLMRLALRRYPGIIHAAAVRHDMYNAETAYVAQREQEGAALVIRPEHALEVRAAERDPDRLRAVYSHGREVALARLKDVEAFVRCGET
ncbi:MAG: patatin family protein [Christensenellaceae bacterium]|nr:patatin family protein [Christensenellaceae bacterium]